MTFGMMEDPYAGCDGTSECVVAMVGKPKARMSMMGAIRKQQSSMKQTL
jgi:hypothetical protein